MNFFLWISLRDFALPSAEDFGDISVVPVAQETKNRNAPEDQLGRAKRGRKRTEEQDLARMARWKPCWRSSKDGS